MKFIFVLISFIFTILISQLSLAYILPAKLILQKTTDNSGSGIYSIEQEVQFMNGNENLTLKETWLIENERTMRLTVTGTKEFQSSIKMQFVYSGGQKSELVAGSKKTSKTPEDFLEKYFNFRTSDSFFSTLVAYKIIPPNSFNKKNYERSASDFKYEQESFLRISRTGGVINYAFGEPSSANSDSNLPGLWIEQDQFLVRKVRLPSQAEVLADNYSQFAKGLSYPRQRTVRWGNNSVSIRLISAAARAGAANQLFQTSSIDISQKLDGLNNQPAKDSILEFYSRFR